MFETTLDFKEQMAKARRTQILMGAAQVFSKRGYHQATIKEIAEAAEVSEGTIYNYFDNKHELLIAMMELLGGWSLEGIVRDQPSPDPREFLTTLLHDLYQLLQERGEFAIPILAEIWVDAELRQALYHQLARPIAAYIEKYLEAHTPLSSLPRKDPLIVAHALLGAVLLSVVLKAANLDPRFSNISAETMIEQLASLFLNDLHPDKELGWFLS